MSRLKHSRHPNRHRIGRARRLFRDPSRRWVAGICAGIANHLGVPVFWVRLLAVVPLLSPLLPIMFLGYVIATVRIPLEPDSLYEDAEEQEFVRSVHSAPSATFGQLRHRMRSLEYRLRSIEAYVTSAEFTIDQDLKAGAKLKSV